MVQTKPQQTETHGNHETKTQEEKNLCVSLFVYVFCVCEREKGN